MANPSIISAELQRVVTTGQENLTTQIDQMQMPFEEELRKYVEVDNDLFDQWITKLKDLLDDLKTLNVTYAELLLNPATYNDAYSSSVLTLLSSAIQANLISLGSGLPVGIEEAIYERARQRTLYDANRLAKRINEDIGARLPYSGMLADLLLEADRDVTRNLTDINRDVMYKQADLAYQNQRDKIKEAIEHERMNMQAFEQRRDRSLRAYLGYDENNVRQHWQYFEYLMNRALQYARICADLLRLVCAGADQITFENWIAMSEIMANGQLRIASLVAQLLPSSQSV